MGVEVEYYEIVIKGQIEVHWNPWFEGMKIQPLPNGDTMIHGPIKDQSALHAMLSRVRDLVLPLLLVRKRSGAEDVRNGLEGRVPT